MIAAVLLSATTVWVGAVNTVLSLVLNLGALFAVVVLLVAVVFSLVRQRAKLVEFVCVAGFLLGALVLVVPLRRAGLVVFESEQRAKISTYTALIADASHGPSLLPRSASPSFANAGVRSVEQREGYVFFALTGRGRRGVVHVDDRESLDGDRIDGFCAHHLTAEWYWVEPCG